MAVVPGNQSKMADSVTVKMNMLWNAADQGDAAIEHDDNRVCKWKIP